jgi:hypothetical protein
VRAEYEVGGEVYGCCTLCFMHSNKKTGFGPGLSREVAANCQPGVDSTTRDRALALIKFATMTTSRHVTRLLLSVLSLASKKLLDRDALPV